MWSVTQQRQVTHHINLNGNLVNIQSKTQLKRKKKFLSRKLAKEIELNRMICSFILLNSEMIKRLNLRIHM